MKTSVYEKTKLIIFERAESGEITESQKTELLRMLNEKKENTDLTPDKIKDIFDELEDMYPDLEDDIEKLAKKIEKSGDAAEDDGDTDDRKDSGDNENDKDEEVSEAALEIFRAIKQL